MVLHTAHRRTGRVAAALAAGALVLTACSEEQPAEETSAESAESDAPSESGETSEPTESGETSEPTESGGSGDAAAPSASGEAEPSDESPSESGEPSGSDGAPSEAFTVVTTGDMLTHFVLQERADALEPGPGFAFGGMLAEVAPLIEAADLAICGQETPLSADNTDLTASAGTFEFNAPRELATAMAGAGYDACNTASNHTWDKGLQGVKQTRAVLQDNDITPIGPVPPGDGGPGHPVLLEAGDATLGVLTYSYNTLNSVGVTSHPDLPWMDPHLYRGRQASGIIEDARAAREAGADVVMVGMHWGAEYQQEPTPEMREIARDVLGSGAVDAIAGAHAHVVQPCETIDGRTVAYGMGNFLSEQGPNRYPATPAATQDGVLLRWTFTPQQQGDETTWSQELEYQPTFVTRPDFVVQPTSESVNPTSFQRTVQAMTALGDGACDATLLK
ncbi:CapA family protein [Kytococcus sedentarius]|uniref:CapA family protein n=1 Tax=Kytococcus sedentarius TaxID=1276 RepID=UPI0035BBAA5D